MQSQSLNPLGGSGDVDTGADSFNDGVIHGEGLEVLVPGRPVGWWCHGKGGRRRHDESCVQQPAWHVAQQGHGVAVSRTCCPPRSSYPCPEAQSEARVRLQDSLRTKGVVNLTRRTQNYCFSPVQLDSCKRIARYVELPGFMLGGCSCCALVFHLNSLGVAFANNALNGDLLFRLSLHRVATVGPLKSFLVSDYMSLFFCENALSIVWCCVRKGSGLAVVVDAHVSGKFGRYSNNWVTSRRDPRPFHLGMIYAPLVSLWIRCLLVTPSGNIATETIDCCHGPLVRGRTTCYVFGTARFMCFFLCKRFYSSEASF